MGGGILSYLQDILGGGGDSVLVNKKEWGGILSLGGILSGNENTPVMYVYFFFHL